jgi:catechol 2,3-dioxygenase
MTILCPGDRQDAIARTGRERWCGLTVPATNLDPPFNLTRASHVRLATPDLEASRAFYEEVIGLVVSDATKDAIHMRGVEEIGHHCLTLVATGGGPACEAVGFRVLRDEDLDRAKRHFEVAGIAAEWVSRDFEERTLRVVDPNGVPLELCSRMETRERLNVDYQLHRGAAALRLDHFQFAVPDVAKAASFYADLGFRTSTYFTDSRAPGRVFGIFMHRKANPADAVFMTRVGPRLHHFACIVADAQCLFRACDIASNLGLAKCIEYGPGRHNMRNGLYTYFRDPAGHRVEILLAPPQVIDIEEAPQGWDETNRYGWSPPPPRSWIDEASPFPGVPLVEPEIAEPVHQGVSPTLRRVS